MTEYYLFEDLGATSLIFQDISILMVEGNDDEYLFTIETIHSADTGRAGADGMPAVCPTCNTGDNFKGIGRIEQYIKDTPAHGKQVQLLLRRRRYQCRSCKSTFMEQPAWLHPNRRATCRLISAIERDIMIMPNSSVAYKYGINDTTVKNIFDAFVVSEARMCRLSTPIVLGIHELYIMGRQRCIFTNVEQKTIVDLEPDQSVTTITNFIKTLVCSSIQVVMTDMLPGHYCALQTVLPDAQIIVSKSHFQDRVNGILEKILRAFRGGMDAKEREKLRQSQSILLRRKCELDASQLGRVAAWRARYPNLIEAYDLKEQLCDIHDLSTSEAEARERWQVWLAACPKTQRSEDGPWFEMDQVMREWGNAVFSYFRCERRPSNGYTENLNCIIRDLDRSGRRYSFEVLRAKLLYSTDFERKSAHTLLELTALQQQQGRKIDWWDHQPSLRSDPPYSYIFGTNLDAVARWLRTQVPQPPENIF